MEIRVIENGKSDWVRAFRRALNLALESMGLSRDALEIHTRNRATAKFAFALYFSDGSSQLSDKEKLELIDLLGDGASVIPVVDTVDNIRTKVPREFGHLNALAIGKGQKKWHLLVAEVLDRAWNLRKIRKIFISYRRIDSLAIAEQLQSALTNRGYLVFLDESSIPPGASFQREIMSWLNDADFVLLLASPRLSESDWVIAELERANLSGVAVLGLCWPYGGKYAQPAIVEKLMHDQTVDLSSRDFRDRGNSPAEQKLSNKKLDFILDAIDQFRALAIHERLNDLIPIFHQAAKSGGMLVKSGTRFGDFVVSVPKSGGNNYVRLVPFRPTLSTMNDLYRDLKDKKTVETATLFYTENDVSDPQKIALDWAAKPDRPNSESGPRRYRLFPYVGDDRPLDR